MSSISEEGIQSLETLDSFLFIPFLQFALKSSFSVGSVRSVVHTIRV